MGSLPVVPVASGHAARLRRPILSVVDVFGADHAAAALVGPDGVLVSHGDADHRYRWASVTKPLTAMTVLVATDRGLLDLDEPAGPPGSTVRHLLSHASGLPFEGDAILSAPGRKRIYSNPGFDLLGDLLASRAGKSFNSALIDWILRPLAMDRTFLEDRPSEGLAGPILGPGDLRPGAAAADAPGARHGGRDAGGGVPRALRRGARHRPIRPVRLGPRRRDP